MSQELATTAGDEIEAFLSEGGDLGNVVEQVQQEGSSLGTGDPVVDAVEAAGDTLGDPASAPDLEPAPEPVAPVSDYNTLVETLEDGTKVFNLHRVPTDVRLAYGDDPEKDRFSRDEMDWRRSTYDRLSNEARELEQKLGGEAFLEDGQSKVRLYDTLQQELAKAPDDFILKVASEATDPIRTAWQLIAKYAAPEDANRTKQILGTLKPAFDSLLSGGLYDQYSGQAAALARKEAELTQQEAQRNFEAARSTARQHVEAELAGHQLDETTWGEIEAEFQARLTDHRANPSRHPAPTFAAVWNDYAAKSGLTSINGAGAVPQAPREQLTPPRIERPRSGGQPSGNGLSAEAEIEAWLAEEAAF